MRAPRTQRKAISKSRRFEVFKRDGFQCQYCGSAPPKAVLHVDHIIPVAKGGTNDDGNLTTACSVCNGGKSARSLSSVPASLSERAALVAEREAQLQGYAEIMAMQRERIDSDVWHIIRELYGEETDEIARSIYQSVKNFVVRLPVDEIMDATEIALSKYNNRQRNFFPYFCGICWRKIKGDAQ